MTQLYNPEGQNPVVHAPVWPMEGAVTPIFDSALEAGSFIAKAAGVTFGDLSGREQGKASSGEPLMTLWFPGIPQAGLIYENGEGKYVPTESATGIARGVLAGKFTTQQLLGKQVTPELPSDQEQDEEQDPERLQRFLEAAVQEMRTRGITANNVEATLQDGRNVEEISLLDRGHNEIATIRFIDGKLDYAPIEEHERRLKVPGLVNKIIRPIQRRVLQIYTQGGDGLVDSSLDELFS